MTCVSSCSERLPPRTSVGIFFFDFFDFFGDFGSSLRFFVSRRTGLGSGAGSDFGEGSFFCCSSSWFLTSTSSSESDSRRVGSILNFHVLQTSRISSSTTISSLSSSSRPTTICSFFDLKTSRDSGCQMVLWLASFLRIIFFLPWSWFFVKGQIFINRFKPTYKTTPSLKISNERPKKNTRSFKRGISDRFVHEQRHA